MQTIYLDISNKGVSPTVYVKQGDVGRKFQVVLTDSGLPYIPVSGSAFSVWYSGASGDGNYTDIGGKSAFTVNENKVIVEMISQMLSNYGDGVLSLALNDPNGNQISTWNIPYFCEPVPGAGSEEAKNYYTAFSQAVENLPYPDASLSVSGKAADAAATGTALAGKAPSGYGLGGGSIWKDTATWNGTGFFRTEAGTPNGGQIFGYQVDLWGDGLYRELYGTYVSDTHRSRLHRTDVNGAVGEWEWENPPMEPGKEYRTTERWYGMPVYCKLINTLGGLPNNSSKEVLLASGMSIISCVGVAEYTNSAGYVVREILPSARCGFTNIIAPTGEANVGVVTNADMSAYTSTSILVKYVKG